MNNYTAIIKKDGNWWIGWIEEIPGVNCQEPTKKELLETLKITLKEALEFNRQVAVFQAGDSYSGDYSLRNASTGSSRDARQAGSTPAIRPMEAARISAHNT